MRIIKFRVFDKLLNKYISWTPNIPFDSEEYVVEQFTGLIDKNGKEIYEGDVIKQPHCERFGAVEWISEADSWDITGWHMKNSEWGDGILGTEIIGNINENLDLIK